jgi:carboxyl-terminal processing protease
LNDPIQRKYSPHIDTGDSARIANAIFFTGTIFGMGLMILILQLWRPAEEEDLEHYREVRDLVLDTFVAEVDEKQLMQSALRGMLHELDGYSDYYVEEETAEVDQDTSGHKVGIGVIMRYEDGPQILFPIEESPAEAAGLRVGDFVLELDERRAQDLSPREVTELMRGEAGSTLRIRVRGRDGAERTHQVTRRQLLIPSVRRTRFVDSEGRIGYIALKSFTNETAAEFDSAMQSLAEGGMQGLVLDLRGNPGGVLSAAVELAQRFIREGVITSTEGRGFPHIERADRDFTPYHRLPLVLLVDGKSASASEVLAGALQDHRAAVLVGQPTYGKGVVQTISRYPERGAIAKVTTSYYYTPSHRSLERGTGASAYGLLPDFRVSAAPGEEDEFESWLQRPYDPHEPALSELHAWQAEAGLDLGLAPPRDAQLEAAVAIFRGEAPALAR